MAVKIFFHQKKTLKNDPMIENNQTWYFIDKNFVIDLNLQCGIHLTDMCCKSGCFVPDAVLGFWGYRREKMDTGLCSPGAYSPAGGDRQSISQLEHEFSPRVVRGMGIIKPGRQAAWSEENRVASSRASLVSAVLIRGRLFLNRIFMNN